MRTLSVGCGYLPIGDVRVDMTRESMANVLAVADRLPFKDGSFGQVIAENILEHMPDALSFLREMRRVLVPSGNLFLITDNAGYLGWWPLLGRFRDRHGSYRGPSPKDRHYALFTPDHVENLLLAAGFVRIEVELFTRWEPTAIQRLIARLVPVHGHSHIAATAWRPA